MTTSYTTTGTITVTVDIAAPADGPGNGSVDGGMTPAALAAFMRGYISGCCLSNSQITPGTKIDVAAGVVNSDDASQLMKIAARTIDFTTVGVDGLDAGSLTPDTWYHVFAIGRPDGDTACLASLTPVEPAIPSGYTTKRRLGSVRTNASSQVIAFRQIGNKFLWRVPVNDYPVTTNPGTGAITPSLTVPSGVQVDAIIWFWLESDTNAPGRKVALITSLEQDDSTPAAGGRSSISAGSGSTGTGSSQSEFIVTTNTSRQIRSRLVPSDVGTRMAITTVGWIDHL